jgi:hypothetical protein
MQVGKGGNDPPTEHADKAGKGAGMRAAGVMTADFDPGLFPCHLAAFYWYIRLGLAKLK